MAKVVITECLECWGGGDIDEGELSYILEKTV